MVLTIALCPIALDVCQVACAEHEHGAAVTSAPAGHHHHAEPADATVAHHHAAPAATVATSSTAMRGVPHACIHGDELPVFVGPNLQIARAPAAVMPTLFALPGLMSGARLFVDTHSVVHSPPLTLTSQLRV